MQPHQIARIVHEANRAFQIEHAAAKVSGPWDEVSDHTRRIVIDGVKGILAGDTPEASHERWRAAKAAKGWTWGPVKDDYKKTHPCMVPFADMLEHEKAKDRLFHAIVHAVKDQCGPAPALEEFAGDTTPERERADTEAA